MGNIFYLEEVSDNVRVNSILVLSERQYRNYIFNMNISFNGDWIARVKRKIESRLSSAPSSGSYTKNTTTYEKSQASVKKDRENKNRIILDGMKDGK